MKFPCEIDIKVFIHAEVQHEQQIRLLLGQHLSASQILSIRVRTSAKGKYQSLSCKVRARSKSEIDRVFASLGNYPDVIMVL